MKLASLKEGGRDGTLVVVSRDLASCRRVTGIAATMQGALDEWLTIAPALEHVYDELNRREGASEPFDQTTCHSPLPRAYQWADGSAYINHVELVRKARGADMPSTFYVDPLVYQGGSDSFIGPRDDIVADEAWGIDFEGEVAVVTGDLEMGANQAQCQDAIRLLMLVNDVSLRNLIPGELAKGFGFFQAKPASAFSPVAVTPDEIGSAWRDGKVHLPLVVHYNDELFGKPNAGVDMTFDFAQLLSHLVKTRSLEAGSIVGSGTVSNKQGSLWGSTTANGGAGYCCLAELRTYETIEKGRATTDYMRHGDIVSLEMFDERGWSIFGKIQNRVRALGGRG